MATLAALLSEHTRSHREAPFIKGAPKVDATDLYRFRSDETGRDGFVTILANCMPFQDSQGRPNFYMFDSTRCTKSTSTTTTTAIRLNGAP